MIPKTIHYCWFGNNPKPKLAKKCIKSWKKHCAGYKIIEWNESNFDITSNEYVKEAYEAKKWAFVTDYVRLWALYHYGGVYMDTDVQVLKPLDPFLEKEKGFSGFESETAIPTGIMAAEKEHVVIKQWLEHYDTAHFLMPDGSYNLQTNVSIITNYMKNKGIVLNNTYQRIEDFAFYPKDYFCPKNWFTGLCDMTDNTTVIHHFDGSWFDKAFKKERKRQQQKQKYGFSIYDLEKLPNKIMLKILGKERYQRLKNKLSKKK